MRVVPSSKRLTWQPWAAVLAWWSGGTVLNFLLERHVSLTSQAMLYVLVVVGAAYTLDYLYSVVCAVGAVLAFNFFFVPPRWTFEVESQEHLILLFVMLVVALVISHQSAALRRETQRAQRNALRATQLQELAAQLASAQTVGEVTESGRHAFVQAFAGPTTLALLPQDDNTAFAADLDVGVRDGLQRCVHDAAVLGPGTGRWPGLNAWYLPLGTEKHMFGAVCIQNVAAADTSGRAHAQALCALLAQTLWRLQLAQAMQQQQIQSTFLAALSHDLHTPLATVLGAASTLETQGDQLDAVEQARLLGSIVSEARRLSTLTENVFQRVQLTNASLPPSQEVA